jgi:competence protein ComEA
MRMPEMSRRRALAYVAALLALLALGGRLFLESEGRPEPDSRERSAHHVSLEAESEPARGLVVHVVGAVREPGLYRLAEGSRVHDAVERAGGAKPKAALELVNLASPVADGQQIVVPVRADAVAHGAAGAPTAPGAVAAPGASAAVGGRVQLNSATLEQLDALPGIGPVTAQEILDYRTEKGAFSSIDELDAVPGIGPARLEQLRELVDL